MEKIIKNFREWVNRPDGEGPLGKYVFPDEKHDKYRTPESDNEPYTDLEKHLEKMLEAHFSTGKKPLPRNAAEQILDLIKNDNYPDIFQSYDRGKAYRGMSMPLNVFEKLFGKSPDPAKWYHEPLNWWHNRARKSGVNFPFSPKTKPGYSPGRDTHAGSWSSSWAWAPGPAEDFAKEISFKEGHIPILLVADASKNTFINARPLYARYDFTYDFKKEKEVIGVGNITLTDIYILPIEKELNENKEPIPLPDFGNVALFHNEESDNHELILYYLTANGPFPFAACGLDMLTETGKDQACIPETWQVSWVYTHKNFRGSGWSKILYGISFNLINKKGHGLTSDQWSGTSDKAKGRAWSKMISGKQLVPRKTPGTPPTGGHSEFDYGRRGFKKTPLDPMDDCRSPATGPEGTGTNSSWIMKNHSQFDSIYQSLVENHENLMTAVSNRSEIESKLTDDAANEFDDAYMGR